MPLNRCLSLCGYSSKQTKNGKLKLVVFEGTPGGSPSGDEFLILYGFHDDRKLITVNITYEFTVSIMKIRNSGLRAKNQIA